MSSGGRIQKIFDNAVMGVGSIVSNVIDTMQANATNPMSLEIVSTGNPTGTYTMEGSNQHDGFSNPTIVTFVTCASAPTPAFPVPAGAGAQTLHAMSSLSYGMGRYVRLRYTGSGGAGVLNAWAFIKAPS